MAVSMNSFVDGTLISFKIGSIIIS